jgi:hypothetical protein
MTCGCREFGRRADPAQKQGEMCSSGRAPVRTRSYSVSRARSAPPGQTAVPVSASTVTFANPSGVRACLKDSLRFDRVFEPHANHGLHGPPSRGRRRRAARAQRPCSRHAPAAPQRAQAVPHLPRRRPPPRPRGPPRSMRREPPLAAPLRRRRPRVRAALLELDVEWDALDTRAHAAVVTDGWNAAGQPPELRDVRRIVADLVRPARALGLLRSEGPTRSPAGSS